jgi:hypothetical protein
VIDDITRLEKAIEKMSDKMVESDVKSHEKMDKLTDSLNSLLLAQTAFYEHKETITRDVEKLERAHLLFKDRVISKLDKMRDDISSINVAIGRGGVLDDINIHKQKNIVAYILAGASLAIAIFSYLS